MIKKTCRGYLTYIVSMQNLKMTEVLRPITVCVTAWYVSWGPGHLVHCPFFFHRDGGMYSLGAGRISALHRQK